MVWGPMDREIIDIGGSRLNDTFEILLAKAFVHEADFPKEVAYTKGMNKWYEVANLSYQTTDELAIINHTCKEVVSQLPSGTKIIDLGAANSTKYEPYVREFIAQEKTCAYIPLDLDRASLRAQIERAKAKFPQVLCVGLWGSFLNGDEYFQNIPPARLFLSMGSIFYNAPDEMCAERCEAFRKHLNPCDRLIVGQDGPGSPGSNSHASYQTPQFEAFFTAYLNAINSSAGIELAATEAWTYKSVMVDAMHYFEVIAKTDLTCKNFDNLLVSAGTSYRMFPSWKRDEADIHLITKKEGLAIKILGKAATSGMRQYLIRPSIRRLWSRAYLAAKITRAILKEVNARRQAKEDAKEGAHFLWDSGNGLWV